MKGKIPRFLRLALAAILVISASLVPLAVNPKPVAATPSLSTSGLTPTMSTVRATTNQVNATPWLPLRLAATGFTASGAGTVIASAGAYNINTWYNNLGTSAASTVTVSGTAVTGTGTVNSGGTLGVGINTVNVTATAGQNITVTLPAGVSGTAMSGPSGQAVVTDSPKALGAGVATTVVITGSVTAKDLYVVIGGSTVGTVVGTTATATADATGNIVVEGTYYNPTTVAATVTLTATDTTSSTSATTTLAVALPTSVTQQIKITAGSLVAYADPSTSPLPNIPTFARVGDGITIEAVSTQTHTGGGAGATTMGDFTAGAAISISFDGTSQPVLGNTTVDSTALSGANNNGNYKKFNSTILIPAVTGQSVVQAAGDPPGALKTVRVSDGVFTIIFKMAVTPKARFTPNTGGKGTTITVAGSGFAKSKGITLYSKTSTASTSALGTAVSTGSIVTDAAGSFSGTFASLGDTKNISAVDGDGNMVLNISRLDETGSTFSAKPSLKVSPTSGKPGDTITLTGSEWPSGAPFKVFFGVEAPDYIATGLTPTATGTLTGTELNTTFVIPSTTPTGAALVPGAYKVYVVEAGNKDASTSITVSALPMTLTLTASPRYGKVTISVSGLSGGGTIAEDGVTLGGIAWNSVTSPANAGLFINGINTSTGVITLDGAGAATFTIRVPSTATIGNNEVSITDNASRVALGKLSVAIPTITLSPTEVARNGTVTVIGKGWAAEQTVTVSAVVTGKTTATASAAPAADGTFATTFTVPTGWAADDNATVTATDGAIGNTSSVAILHVPVVSITVTPTTAKWGETITVKGSGFKGGTTIRGTLPAASPTASGANIFPTAVYTDSAGNFTGIFLLPSVEKGVQTVGADDGSVSATATVNVLEAPATVTSALAPIAASLVRVWAFDGATQKWLLYDPAVPAELNTLAALTKGGGYFINVKVATSILSGGVTINLSVGWNLIGWLG